MKPFLQILARGEALTEQQSEAAFSAIMAGEATQAHIAALLTAMRVRGETRAELTGAVRAMRARMTRITAPPNAIDVCGTGGDGFGTLNVSTAAAFVTAACGVPVAKHGNRAVSSRAGGIDVLAALGLDTETPFADLEVQLASAGIAFLNAQRHHPGVRFAAPVRTELGFRTIFNLLGPLANPAGVTRQLTGVYDPAWAPAMAETLGMLGSERAWIVHGQGLDELTLAGITQVSEWNRGALRHFTITPEEAGFGFAPVEAIKGGDAAANAAALIAFLQGRKSAYRDTVLLNAAAALVIAEKAATLAEGVLLAASAVDRGAALYVLENLRRKAAPYPNPGLDD